MDYSILKEIGLTANEIKVYVALIQKGSCGSTTIAKDTALHAPRVYDSLDRLVEKGLASVVIEGKRKVFSAVPPKRLLELLDERREAVENTLPFLNGIFNSGANFPAATIYQGNKGVWTVCKMVLQELKGGGEYLDFGVSGLFKEVLGEYHWKIWQSKKKSLKISSRCIFDERVRKNEELLGTYFGQARFISKKYYSPTDTFVLKDYVILFLCSTNPPLAIVIKDKATAEGYKNLFSLMWKNALK